MIEIEKFTKGSIVFYPLAYLDGTVESVDKMGYVTWLDRDGEEFVTPAFDLTLIWSNPS